MFVDDHFNGNKEFSCNSFQSVWALDAQQKYVVLTWSQASNVPPKVHLHKLDNLTLVNAHKVCRDDGFKRDFYRKCRDRCIAQYMNGYSGSLCSTPLGQSTIP